MIIKNSHGVSSSEYGAGMVQQVELPLDRMISNPSLHMRMVVIINTYLKLVHCLCGGCENVI